MVQYTCTCSNIYSLYCLLVLRYVKYGTDAIAIKAYLRAGYKPVLYTGEMEERWCKFLSEHGYSGIDAVDEDGNFIKKLN